MILWIYLRPQPRNSDLFDSYILGKESRTKPSFATAVCDSIIGVNTEFYVEFCAPQDLQGMKYDRINQGTFDTAAVKQYKIQFNYPPNATTPGNKALLKGCLPSLSLKNPSIRPAISWGETWHWGAYIPLDSHDFNKLESSLLPICHHPKANPFTNEKRPIGPFGPRFLKKRLKNVTSYIESRFPFRTQVDLMVEKSHPQVVGYPFLIGHIWILRE